MRTLANWLIVMFMGMFWAFRVVVTYMDGVGKEFFVKPINTTTEIILLFFTLICIVLVIKRKMFGGIFYLLANFSYFGVNFYQSIEPVLKGEAYQVSNAFTTFVSLLAIILSIIVVMDLSFDKTKRPDDKKTEWFYKNKDLDRQLDERADKNNYKLY